MSDNETDVGESSRSVLGKRKEQGSVERTAQGQAEEDIGVDETAEEVARRKEKVEGKKRAMDEGADTSSKETERGRTRQRRRIADDDQQPPTSQKRIRRAVRGPPSPPIGSDHAEDDDDMPTTHEEPCTQCVKKRLRCLRAATGYSCTPCRGSKRRCTHAAGRRGRSVSRARSHAPPKTRDPSPSSPPLAKAKTQGRRQSRAPASKAKQGELSGP